ILGVSVSSSSNNAYVEYVVASDGPYKLKTFSHLRADKRSLTTCIGNGSPARFITRTLLGMASCSINTFIAEGTVLIRDTSTSWTRRSSASSTTTHRPPTLRGANISKTERSKFSEVLASTFANSAGVYAVFTQSSSATALKWHN